VAYGGEQVAEVGAIEAGDGVAEADRDACGEAGGEPEDSLLAAGAGKFAGIECGDGWRSSRRRPSWRWRRC
jgi:hypothetical protein